MSVAGPRKPKFTTAPPLASPPAPPSPPTPPIASLSAKVLSGDQDATKRYLTFLSAGGSKYPIDLLKDAGVDMTTNEPLDLTIRRMNEVMDETEKLLGK